MMHEATQSKQTRGRHVGKQITWVEWTHEIKNAYITYIYLYPSSPHIAQMNSANVTY